MSNSTVNKVAGETRQISMFVKGVEAVVVAKILKYVVASEANLSKLDQRSPAMLLAKAIKKTIGTAGGDRIGKAYFAYQAVKTLQQSLGKAITEAEEMSEQLDPRAKALIELLDEEMTDPDDSHLIDLKESRKGYDYKLLSGKQGRLDFITNEVFVK
jgi:hypothetical protein